MKDQNVDFSDFESRLINSGNSDKIGKLNGQRFYAVRWAAGQELRLPFARKKFSALINANGNVSAESIREVGEQLLKHGMVCAMCIGDAAEQVSENIDDLIDNGGFTFDGFTPYTQIENSSLSESLEIFALPTDLTKVSLILTLGDSRDHHKTLDALNQLFSFDDFADDADAEPEEDGLDVIFPIFSMMDEEAVKEELFAV